MPNPSLPGAEHVTDRADPGHARQTFPSWDRLQGDALRAVERIRRTENPRNIHLENDVQTILCALENHPPIRVEVADRKESDLRQLASWAGQMADLREYLLRHFEGDFGNGRTTTQVVIEILEQHRRASIAMKAIKEALDGGS